MKRTHKLNVGGFSFNVEDDAVKALETYLDSIKEAYAGVEDEKEIIDDIEERIGELLVERTTAERVVSINEVNAVKSTMGEFSRVEDTPEIDGEEAPKSKAKTKKRLYRDLDNRAIGGVCSGLSAYFDVDVVIFRVVFAVLLIGGVLLSEVANCGWCDTISGIAFVAYVLLWICVPAAKTVEQRCELSGKPVNAKQFDARRGSRPAESRPSKGSGIGQILLVILGVIMMINGLTSLAGCAVYDFIPRIVEKYCVDEPDAINVINTIFSSNVIISLVVSGALWGIWNIFVGVLLTFDLKAPRWRPGLILFIAFVISAIICGFFVIRACLNVPMIFNI